MVGSVPLGQQGSLIVSLIPLLGGCVLSLCGGSGSLMECCMQSGRSCIMFEKDGSNLFGFLISLKTISWGKVLDAGGVRFDV